MDSNWKKYLQTFYDSLGVESSYPPKKQDKLRGSNNTPMLTKQLRKKNKIGRQLDKDVEDYSR